MDGGNTADGFVIITHVDCENRSSDDDDEDHAKKDVIVPVCLDDAIDVVDVAAAAPSPSKSLAESIMTDQQEILLNWDDVRSYLEWFVSSYNNGVGTTSGSALQLGRNKPGTSAGASAGGTEAGCSGTSGGLGSDDSTKPNSVHGQSSSSEVLGETVGSRTLGTDTTSLRNSRLAAAIRMAGQDMSMPADGLAPTLNAIVGVPLTPDEFILRELADIRRLLLQRFLMQGGGGNNNNNGGGGLEPTTLDAEIETDMELFDILGVLTDVDGISAVGRLGESTPHYPVGDWMYTECEICLEHQWLYRRACCGFPACGDCMKRYVATKVIEGVVKMECCSPRCRRYVHRDEISARLDGPVKLRFYQFLVQANADPYVKTCPGCNHITRFVLAIATAGEGKPKVKNTKKHPDRCRVVCSECSLTWCFSCHAPWHEGITCRQYRKGDRLLKTWAHEVQHGQLNAQKCPKCQVYIQRTTGCDHMHCTRCKTDFCYRCGDRLRKLRFFGDHYSKLSIFGCKYRYKADKPLQRKLIRGAVFGGKLMVAPILGTLGACAGAIALGFGIFILPVYGGVRLYQRLSPYKHPIGRPRFPLPPPLFHFDNEIPLMPTVEVHHHHIAAGSTNQNGRVGNGVNHRPLEPRPAQWAV